MCSITTNLIDQIDQIISFKMRDLVVCQDLILEQNIIQHLYSILQKRINMFTF